MHASLAAAGVLALMLTVTLVLAVAVRGLRRAHKVLPLLK
jgi:hypothetical protein